MISSSFRPVRGAGLASVSALCLLLLLGGCASWFGNVDQNANYAHPGFGSGPLNPPEAAPVPPVQITALPLQATGAPVSAATVAPAPPHPEAGLPQAQTASGVASTSPTAPQAINPNTKIKVAILLPLTGKNAALGQAMLNAAQLAVFDAANSNFELMPRDTGEGEAAAATAARDAIASGAQLLIGPLFASSVPAVKAVAQSTGVSILTLSTDTTLADRGVYVMGIEPNAQVERVVAFASAEGLHHFAALIPTSPYGALVGQAFQVAVARHGGTVVIMETYDMAKHNSDAHVHALLAHRGQYDALFIPTGGSELAQITGQLAMSGFDSRSVRLLGTGLWDVSGLGQQSFLVGGWYAAPDALARRNFISAYAATYKQEPPRLATLAYDATALAATLAKRGLHFDAAALTNPNGFAGVDGIFRLTPNGLVERGLAVNEITTEASQPVSPAPSTFIGLDR